MNGQDDETVFITPQQLRELLHRQHKVVIVDVRAAEEFPASHVEGAINIPAHQLAAEIGWFTKDTTMVTVCNLGGTRSCDADLTGVFCTSGSERKSTLEGRWYADETVQAGADRELAAAN
jgi:3-mercaptopyruvate sulfurtransferase SseA